MKRPSKSRPTDERGREYSFDYARAQPNRFASRMATGSVAVVLDPEVASVFRTADSVNNLLRSVISVMPRNAKARKRRKAESP
jgi:hypothetical protein